MEQVKLKVAFTILSSSTEGNVLEPGRWQKRYVPLMYPDEWLRQQIDHFMTRRIRGIHIQDIRQDTFIRKALKELGLPQGFP